MQTILEDSRESLKGMLNDAIFISLKTNQNKNKVNLVHRAFPVLRKKSTGNEVASL